jgi:hypothetical protein
VLGATVPGTCNDRNRAPDLRVLPSLDHDA